jgi:hypothetical protein
VVLFGLVAGIVMVDGGRFDRMVAKSGNYRKNPTESAHSTIPEKSPKETLVIVSDKVLKECRGTSHEYCTALDESSKKLGLL